MIDDESKAEETPAQTTQPVMPVVQGYLTELTCDAGNLTPDFKYDVFEYTVYADSSAERAELTGTPAAFSDVVTYSSGGELNFGNNIRTVTVTAEDGTENVYTVNIIRAEQEVKENKTEKKDSAAPKTEHDKYKDMLNPALAIVLVTLIVSLFIVLSWIKGLGKNKKNKKGKNKR